MSLHQRHRFHGILLYRKAYREHDLLVKFFTAEFGKKMFLIRGAKRQHYKMAADIMPFTYGIYEGSIAKDGLSYLNNSRKTEHYFHIIHDIDLNAYATYIMGLLDAALDDGQVSKKWFNKLFYGLRLIDQGLDPEIITNIFEIQLLNIFGVAPHLKNCVLCGKTDLPLDFSEKYGGLICQRHWGHDPYRFHLKPETVFDLQRLSCISLRRIGKISVHKTTKKQLRRLLDSIYHDSVGLHLRSKHFLDEMHWMHW